MSDREILELIFYHEGKKYTNIPEDKGGPTKFGITQGAYSTWLGRKATPADVKAITQEVAEAFYLTTHIRPFDQLPEPLRPQVIDIGIHRGVRTGIMALQEVLGVTVDGWVGPMTLAAIAETGYVVTNNLLVGARLQHFATRIKKDPSQEKFKKGWRRRALSYYVKESE